MDDRGASGFTLVELITSIALFASFAAIIGSVLATTQGLASRTKVSLNASQEHRRNLDAVARVFRGAASTSFTNFGSDDTSTTPSFQAISGIDSAGTVVLDTAQSISWQPNRDLAPGIDLPGDLVLTRNGVTSIIARRVRGGTFLVELMGNAVSIGFTTYSSDGDDITAMVSGRTAVALRN